MREEYPVKNPGNTGETNHDYIYMTISHEVKAKQSSN
jgi:hypothetical protein